MSILPSILTVLSLQVKTIAGFPSTEAGYDLGVSACYAGVIDDHIIMAGGCNFPEPGKKKYYAGIYAAKASSEKLDWKLIGFLPEPAAYGGVVARGDSLVFIGGNNAEHSLSSVLSLHLDKEGKAEIHPLPDLPITADNMALAVASDDALYVIGGNQDGKASGAVWQMQPGEAWEKIAEIPGDPRVQPVCQAIDGGLYIWGGFYADGLKSTVPTEGCRYDLANKTWSMLPSPCDAQGTPLTLTGATSIAVNVEGHPEMICLGGVNKEIFWDAISGTYSLVEKENYLKRPVEWYKFSGNLLRFDVKKGCWQEHPAYHQSLARAGAQVVMSGDTFYYIGGELKPSVRTNEIVGFKL